MTHHVDADPRSDPWTNARLEIFYIQFTTFKKAVSLRTLH